MCQTTKLIAARSRKLVFVVLAGVVAAACGERAPTAPSMRAQASEARAEPHFQFSTIDVPGGTLTTPQGINAAGDVVGYYHTPDHWYGFVYDGRDFTTVQYPGADYTDVRGIGPDGELVGTFGSFSEELAAYHGYRRTVQGEFIPVHYPGHLYEILQRILPDGTILGCRHDHDQGPSMKGIVIARDGDSEIAANASMINGATPDLSLMVGRLMEGSVIEGFTIEQGTLTPFMVPGSVQTAAWDVNARGDIVGLYRNTSGFHGFVRTEAGFTTLDYPGASDTRAFATNARGDVVGYYTAGGVQHGFLARRL